MHHRRRKDGTTVYPKRMVAFMAIVGGAALLLMSRSVLGGLAWVRWDDLIFLGAVWAATFFPVQLPRGNASVSVGMPVMAAAGIILGPSAGLWISAIGSINQRTLTGKIRWPSVLFNRAQAGLVGWAAGAVFEAFGGSPRSFSYGQTIWLVLAACFIAFLANMVLVAAAIGLRQHQNLYKVWRGHMSWMTVNFFVTVPLVYMMTVVYRLAGAWPELLLMIPLALSRWIYVLLLRVRRMYQLSMQALLAGLEAKDPYTYGHSLRVGHYAAMLARHMGLSEDRVELIGEAGRLHDIGKVHVPDAILNKPAGLTPQEILSVQRHPVMGGDLLDTLELVGCVKFGAAYHHERWDGNGYPYRLRGQDIPLETRIISVVDTYDAMTSNRPYRAAMSHECAVEEIQRVAGSQLDPVVVAAFGDMVKDYNLAETEGRKFAFSRFNRGHRRVRRRG